VEKSPNPNCAKTKTTPFADYTDIRILAEFVKSVVSAIEVDPKKPQ
jgi:hypothetical protein